MPVKILNYIRDRSAKTYFKTKARIRSSQEALDALNDAVNPVIQNVLKAAAQHAKSQRRKTVLREDMDYGIHKHVAQRSLEPDEIVEQVLQSSAADIGNIVKGLSAGLRKYQAKK